jgi:hypothetical protein
MAIFFTCGTLILGRRGKLMSQSARKSSPFSQVDDLTREISELASAVNARFVIDENKLQDLRAPSVEKEVPPPDVTLC